MVNVPEGGAGSEEAGSGSGGPVVTLTIYVSEHMARANSPATETMLNCSIALGGVSLSLAVTRYTSMFVLMSSSILTL